MCYYKENYFQTPFLQANHIVEEASYEYLDKEKSEECKKQLIAHFDSSQEELSIYPFSDLIQMGVSMKNV